MKIDSAKATLKRLMTAIFAMVGVSVCARGAVTYPVTAEEAASYGGATGGDIVNMIVEDDGSVYLAHIFTNTAASATLTIPSANNIMSGTGRILLVGGGGAGGGDCGGGGGAGGVVISNNWTFAEGSMTVTVGAGGASAARGDAGHDGSATTLLLGGVTWTALGGGGGAKCNNVDAKSGGSGGGGARSMAKGNGLQPSHATTPGFGNGGGAANDYRGGGGGGAGSAGANAVGNVSGNGGDGIESDITGVSKWYGGGGGGGGNSSDLAGRGFGGKGGGGHGSLSGNYYGSQGYAHGWNGEPGTGGGGGGSGGDSSDVASGAGGSGIAVIRYQVDLSEGGDPLTSADKVRVAPITAEEAVALGGATGGDLIRKVRNDDGTFDIVHIFTNTASAAVFGIGAVNGVIADSGRFLAVGGGGGGGSSSGGGGGAGGFVAGNVTLSQGQYQVIVGAGGAGGASSNVRNRGTVGSDTTITNLTTSTQIALALGGGAGGTLGSTPSTHRPGGNGGSGGGSVRGYSTSDDGSYSGKALQPTEGYPAGGYGCDGGTGKNDNNYGGGGGGAGGAGVGGTDCTGGAGMESDILGYAQMFAAGGDGAARGYYPGADGEVATGNGGGGGGGKENAGAGGGTGGSGVVVIRYTIRGGEVTEMEDGSTLYKFDGDAIFTLEGAAQVRVLAVGGGGAGGSGSASTSQGGNGGGGAGRFIDTTNIWQGATYTIDVGAGGKASTSTAATTVQGEDGEPTMISLGENNIIYMPGGGGGAYRNVAGSPGGSGGGGSKTGLGGAAVSTYGGIGYPGGAGSGNRVGAGGGGAGGSGTSPESTSVAGNGGPAIGSDITGNVKYYAAGGAGGNRAGGGGVGGAGADNISIGGNGGEPGRDGTGSGGGGGSNSSVGGAGGSGIVYIRVIRYMPKTPDQAEYSFEYANTEYVLLEREAIDEDVFTITTGDNVSTNRIAATAKGVYTYTLALTADARAKGFTWFDGTTADKHVTLTISKTISEIYSIHQDGWQIGEERPPLQLDMNPEGVPYLTQFANSELGPWATKSWDDFEEVPGTYWLRIVVEESDNYTGVTSDPVSFKIWDNDVSKYPSYLGYHADVAAGDGSSAERYVRVTISDGVPYGFSYDKAQEDGSDIRFTYFNGEEVVLLPFTFDGGWNYGGETVAVVQVPAGVDEFAMNWGLLEDHEVPDSPDGSDIVSVDVSDAIAAARSLHATIVITNASSTAVANFPMAVVLVENSPAGFSYSTAANDGSDLVFTSEDGTILPSEVEKWDSNGSSLVWVKVPQYVDGAVLTLHWGQKYDEDGNPVELTVPESSQVWSDYAGVWHMGSGNNGTSGTYGTDATADSAGASAGTLGNKTTSVDGIFGSALAASEQGEPLILVTASDAVNSITSGAFTVSFYTKYNSTGDGTSVQYLFSRRPIYSQAGYAGLINENSRVVSETSNTMRILFGEAWGSGGNMTASKFGMPTETWIRNDVYFNGGASGRFEWWINGVYVDGATWSNAYVSNGTTGLLGIGGLAAANSDSNINGAMDEFRIRSGAPNATLLAAETNQWQKVSSGEATYVTKIVTVTPSEGDLSETVVTPNSKFVNRWVSLGYVTPLQWQLGYLATVSTGSAAYGIVNYVFKGADGTDYVNTLPETEGSYNVVFYVDAGDFGTCHYGKLTYTYPEIIDILPKNDGTGGLAGNCGSATRSGRVLLANDDILPGYEIYGQCYWQTNSMADTYWVHEAESPAGSVFDMLEKGTLNTLKARESVDELCGSDRIWYLDNVRIGNTYPATLVESNAKNFLPWSSTSKVLAEDGVTYLNTQSARVSVNLVMRSVVGAAVYSPCYTNGIGTIYFDAVNGWLADNNFPTNYTIVVEFATNCVESVGSDKLPTDLNLYALVEEKDEDGNVTNTYFDVDYSRANWQSIDMVPLYYDGAEFHSSYSKTFGDVVNSFDGPVSSLCLDETAGGGHDKFFRVRVPVLDSLNGYRGPIRFRIRRTTTKGVGADNDNFILLDNLIVSYPAMTANLEPKGKFDPTRYGKKALGTECAFDVPFPAVGDSIKGLAKGSFETNPLVVDADTSTFVTGAKLHYRWRYLNQDFGEWAAVAVAPNTWEAATPLNLSDYSDRPGDVEYWYELLQNAPYYSYTDYSGLDIGLGGLYSENIPVVTNRCDMGTLESCGTDWFVRLREGKSPYESLQIAIDDGSKTNIVYMEVVKDHTWRGYFQTFTNQAGTVRMQVRGVNCQTFGLGEFVESVTNMYSVAALTNMPVSTTMELGTEDDWNDLDIDAMTGYLMFQIDDSTRSLTIVHADYQSFNEWNDAKGNKFVGNSSDNLTKSGTSAGKKKYTADWTAWTSMAAGSDDWTVPYIGWADVTHMLGREPNVEFQSDTSGNWQVGPGIWVSKWYDDSRNNMGVALQMAGQGRGYVQMTDSNILPRGFGTLNFNARLAQTIEFDNFVYYAGVKPKTLTNYTFTVRGAFDTSSNTKFRGKATLSLVAHYLPRIGCYEFRVEQVNANNNTNPSGIGKRSQVFSLYRWRAGDDGSVEPTLLGQYTNDSFDIPETSSLTGNYMPLYIAVSNDVSGNVCIMAGVGRSSVAASAAATSESGKKYYSICYKDTSSNKISTGSFGCLSANSPAVMIRPYYYDRPVGFLDNGVQPNAINRYSNNDITFSGTRSYFDTDMKVTNPEDLDWVITQGRYENFYRDANVYGFTAPTTAVTQKLIVYTVPVSEVSSATASKDWKWTAVTNIVVSGFGSNGKLTAYNVPLYVAEDSYIKIAVDGKPTDTRRDVVIDSLTVTSWRGASWNEDIDDLITYAPNNFEPSEIRCNFNEFSFFDAWVTNIVVSGNTKTNALLLSARRTPAGGVCGIKSPLMNGEPLGSDKGSRGIGLGMVSFSYRNAQPNVNLLVQIATNGVGSANMATINNLSEDNWVTWTNVSFSAGSGRPSSGVASVYIGLHGVEGALRVIMDPAVVNAVSKQLNPSLFGDIFITGIKCTDEPELDDSSWWGWNLRGVGISSASGSDEENRMYLPDMTQSADELGMSMALNSSVSDEIYDEDSETYKANMPFVQTPVFGTNLVGEIMFRARKYGYESAATDAQDAYVTLLGAKEDAPEKFTEITNFCVNAKTFKTYSYKTEPGVDYAAFRLAVSGVDGVDRAGIWPGSGSPVRVILDEVLVTEAVRAKMGFRNVGAFRGYPGSRNFIMNDLLIVPNVPSEQEQPLCNETWGVQCEIYKELLPDEIDLERTPNVRLHYFEGKLPWGWNNWKTKESAKTVRLTLATDSTEDNLVYRSSNKSLPANVIAPIATSGVTYQYMLEVEFWQVGSTVPSTNWLTSAQWTKPEWYNQIDFNAEGGAFSAYTILDTVAPHWAWFNEVNLFDEYDLDLQNSEVSNQYIEVVVPAEADITGWKIKMLEAVGGHGEVVTNTLAVFGENGLSGTKPGLLGMDANKVYRVIATPKVSSQYLRKSDGTLDGTWQVQIPTSTISAAGEILGIQPFGLQLVRASDIVEHEIVCIGTNWWGNSVNYGGSYHPTNTVNTLNKSVKGANFFYVGADEGGDGRSVDVFKERGETVDSWTNRWVKTPGRINTDENGKKQDIDPNHPTPNGDTIIVYCNLDTTMGERLTQTAGDVVDSPRNEIQYLVKGSELGLTIRYKAAPWFKLESVTTNMVGSPVSTEIPFTTISEAERLYETVVGIGASNNFSVVAKPNVQDKLRELGLGDDNRYTDAVVDWLSGGRTLKGEFANDDGEIRLAEYRGLNGSFITNLTLTSMYWLDMDPTAGGLALYGGMSSAPTPRTYEYFDGYMIDENGAEVANYSSFTNLRMNVKMWITNENNNTAWAPYTLRGVRPGETTAGSKFSLKQWAADTNVTFKITGLLGNGLVSSSDRNAWVPLRWFVFRCDDDFVSTSFDENFETKIEIEDPYTPASPGYAAWRHWFEEHGGKFGQGCNLFYFWSLDDNTKPIGFEMLEKENYYDYE